MSSLTPRDRSRGGQRALVTALAAACCPASPRSAPLRPDNLGTTQVPLEFTSLRGLDSPAQDTALVTSC